MQCLFRNSSSKLMNAKSLVNVRITRIIKQLFAAVAQ